ncbi:MAG: transposase family protein [Myxococcales bacterium]|nr:transposase family protein [Myxococcales bacterium]
MATKTPRNAFWNYFEDLEDPRDQGRNFTYSFESVGALALMETCCEQNSLTKIVLFLILQWKWFAPYFPDHDGPPSGQEHYALPQVASDTTRQRPSNRRKCEDCPCAQGTSGTLQASHPIAHDTAADDRQREDVEINGV